MPKSINPLTKRKSSSPFSTAQRTKPGARTSRLADKETAADRLDDIGLVPHLAPSDAPQDIVGLIRYIQEHTFEDIPDRTAGMNSERIAETLQYRLRLPPIVSVAHLYALSKSTTDTERQLARFIAGGKIRRITIPGRGKGGSTVGEGVVLVEDFKSRLLQETTIQDEVKNKYIELMRAHPTSLKGPVSSFSQSEIRSLVSAGFFTNPAALLSDPVNHFVQGNSLRTSSISSAGSSAVTGTLAAVGGYGAITNSGGAGMFAIKDSRPSLLKPRQEMTFSLPATGLYLSLLTEARSHLIFLLKQLSPKYKEATYDSIEEKWNGNVLGDPTSRVKRSRGEWSGALPGQTKRWRQFRGLEFEWVLAESLGSGLVELFDTGSVGVGVRAT